MMNCELPKKGDRTREGEKGPGIIISSNAHQDGFTTEEARFLYDAFPQAI